MNTKTMRLPPRRVLTSDKRVISTAVAGDQMETTVTDPPPPPITSILKITPAVSPSKTTAAAESGGSNQLLAGFLAHEFLNKGTLFGEHWDPAQAEAGLFPTQDTDPGKTKPSHNIEPSDIKRRRYVEVANILRVGGAHLPGIVNPSGLARSLKL